MKRYRVLKAVLRLSVPGMLVLGVLVPAGTAGADPSATLVGSYLRPTLTSGQGLATLSPGSIVYRGDWSIPLRLLFQGWQHIGDPGAGGRTSQTRNYLVDAYQGSGTATSKLFEVTTPTGQRYDFVHPLAPGEALNNSFAAISPDGKWMVSGEWNTMNHLLVFPAPVINPSYQPASSGVTALPLVGYINLDQPVTDVQGCDFASSTVLLCSTDGSLKQILQVTLPGALTGPGDVDATVKPLVAAIPQRSICAGTFETEGIDFYGSQIRVEMIPPSPCSANTAVYVYNYNPG